MGKRAVTAGLFVCAAVAACNLGTSSDDEATSEAANTAARQPILAPTWTKCWVEKDTSTTEPAQQQHAVKCRYDAPDAKQPIKPQGMLVDVHYAAGSNHIENLEGRSGEEVVVQKVAGDQFPIEINVFVYGETFRNVGLAEDFFTLKTNVASPDGLTSESPLVVKQPFDIWPVTVIAKTFLYYVQLESRTFSIAPFIAGQSEPPSSDANARGKILGRSSDAAPIVSYFVAPKEGELKGELKLSTGVGSSMTAIAAGARIPAPGVYVVTDTEFRKATDEEASVVGPAPLPPTTTDASAPESDGGTEAAAEASAPRDCGVPGKKCCGTSSGFGGTCDPGSYCPSQQNTCEACGGPGQKCCGGFGGTCNAGSYCPSQQNTCEACGGPGQKCCGGFGGTCNAGSYCPSQQNTCEACGKVGQKCCGGFGGTCESGARCPSQQNTCVAN